MLTLEPVPRVRLSCAYLQMTENGGEDEAAAQKKTAEFCLFKFCALPERTLMRSLCISLPTQLPSSPPQVKILESCFETSLGLGPGQAFFLKNCLLQAEVPCGSPDTQGPRRVREWSLFQLLPWRVWVTQEVGWKFLACTRPRT